MPAITLTQAQTRLQQYLDAEAAVLTGQRYEIGGRMLQRADLGEIRKGIEHWERKVNELTQAASGRRRSVTLRPLF